MLSLLCSEIDLLLGNIDLHRCPRAKQFPHLRQALDCGQEPRLSSILPLLDPRRSLDALPGAPEIGLLDLEPANGNPFDQQLFQGSRLQTG
jgi:hypothetical protein